MSDSDDILLDVDDIHVSYGEVPALRGVTIRVAPGDMVALLGANGAGKTTTLRAISGLVHPKAGRILFAGQRIDGLDPPQVVRRGIAHLPEGRDLFPNLTVKENLRYGAWPRRRDHRFYRQRLEEVYSAFPKLKERSHQKAGTLSGGEQQMLAVSMALMSGPQLLIVDELSLGLAPLVVKTLFETLAQVNATGTAILLVEQFVPLALAHTQRAYVLAKGQVVIEGASSQLASDPALLAAYLGEAVGGATADGAPAVAAEDSTGHGPPMAPVSTNKRQPRRTRAASNRVES